MDAGRAYSVDRMVVRPYTFDVPLDWSAPDGETIRVHARTVCAAEKQNDDLPLLCWFQGGPGFEAGSPHERSGHLKELLARYRVVLLDQRGTGLSTPLDGILTRRADLAWYLRQFRADSIVRDADYLRSQFVGDGSWTIAGQSFGGFCSLTYLSLAPERLAAALNFGGLAPVQRNADEVYRALVRRVMDRNGRYFTCFPDDAERVRAIVDALRDGTGRRDGEVIRPEQFLTLGNSFGHQHGAAEVHGIVERAASDLALLGGLSQYSLRTFADALSLNTNPVYAVLHEAIYCQGEASRWAAHRVIGGLPEFALDARPAPYFTGEMIFPWMFDALPALRPLAAVADELAEYDEWPDLYDLDRLRANELPLIGVIYYDDLYVDRGFALETAELVGNCSYWLTNELEHGGIRNDPARTVGRAFEMLDQTIRPA
jgi:pimeloyl-ACP methyl ester carboxylesterase